MLPYIKSNLCINLLKPIFPKTIHKKRFHHTLRGKDKYANKHWLNQLEVEDSAPQEMEALYTGDSVIHCGVMESKNLKKNKVVPLKIHVTLQTLPQTHFTLTHTRSTQ